MTPVFCTVEHDPDAGTYGDCVRACVATMLDLSASDVPHFLHDNDSNAATARLTKWLRGRDLAPFFAQYGCETLDEILAYMGETNSGVTYMLTGNTSGGGHAVVCKGGAVVHNPAWIPTPLIGPGDNGHWVVMVLARV